MGQIARDNYSDWWLPGWLTNFIVEVSLHKTPTDVDFGDYDKEYLASTNDEELIEKPNQHYTN
jgi:hypothetical protein